MLEIKECSSHIPTIQKINQNTTENIFASSGTIIYAKNSKNIPIHKNIAPTIQMRKCFFSD